MMQKLLSFILCVVMLAVAALPAKAVATVPTEATQITVLEGGITFIDEIVEISTGRSSDKSYRYTKSILNNGVTVGIIAITALFRYDGNSVYVISKAVTQTDTYEGWNYKQNSFTSSGGTVTLDAKLTKLLVLNIPFTMTLTCDKNGNISYS